MLLYTMAASVFKNYKLFNDLSIKYSGFPSLYRKIKQIIIYNNLVDF